MRAALIPENRKQEGLALIRTVSDNLVLASLARLFPRRWFSPGAAARTAQDNIAAAADRHAERPPGGPVPVGRQPAEGGRRQVAQRRSAACYLFDEPTRGIDVGAKAEVFALIDRLVKEGAGVLMISSELAEVVKVCDRAYVMREHRIVGELGARTS